MRRARSPALRSSTSSASSSTSIGTGTEGRPTLAVTRTSSGRIAGLLGGGSVEGPERAVDALCQRLARPAEGRALLLDTQLIEVAENDQAPLRLREPLDRSSQRAAIDRRRQRASRELVRPRAGRAATVGVPIEVSGSNATRERAAAAAGMVDDRRRRDPVQEATERRDIPAFVLGDLDGAPEGRRGDLLG